MAYCKECGSPVPDDAKYCMACGTPVVALSTATSGQRAATRDTAPTLRDSDDTGDVGIDATPSADSAEKAFKAASAVARAIANDIQAPDTPGEFVMATWDSSPLSTLDGATARIASAAQGAVRQAAREGFSGTRQTPTSQTEQFQHHQPSVHSSSQMRGEAPARKKSKLPLILGAVGAVAVVAVLALYVVPLFIPHPHDPNTHTALTSSSSASTSASTSTSSATPSDATGSASTPSTVDEPSASSESDPAASSAAAPTKYSTYERPKLSDFVWLDGETMKGNVPADAQRIVDFGALTGSWKGYIFDSNKEWLTNPFIEAGQAGATFSIDWYYVRTGSSGEGQADSTPTSMFTGTFDGGILDATGPGRITIAAFWQKDGHQYATGSYMWPSGETSTITLVRP